MERDARVDLPELLLEAADELAVPGEEARLTVHVRALVDLILLVPVGHAVLRVEPTVEPDDRVDERRSLGLRDVREVLAQRPELAA